HDPGRTDDPSPIVVSPVLPLLHRQQRLQRDNHIGASAVYASRAVLPLPMQDSLPVGWLAFAGRELNPLDRYERFLSCYILFPLSWIYPDATMPSLSGSAYATRERFRTFAAHSFLTCRPLRPRGVRHR